MKYGISSGFRRGFNLECFDRACHLADFICAVETRKNHFEIAIGKPAHCIAHRYDRPGDSAADRDGQQQHEQKLSDRQHFNNCSVSRAVVLKLISICSSSASSALFIALSV
jgi:hypothetical protein